MELAPFSRNTDRGKRIREIATAAGFEIHQQHCPSGSYVAKGGWHQAASKLSQPFDTLDTLKHWLEEARFLSLDALPVYDKQSGIYYLASKRQNESDQNSV